MYKGEDQRKGKCETKIMNVLAEVLAGKFRFVRRELEESDVAALHRAIGGAAYIPFCDFFRALRGLRTLFSYSPDKTYFTMVDEMIIHSHWEDQHNYHDRRTY